MALLIAKDYDVCKLRSRISPLEDRGRKRSLYTYIYDAPFYVLSFPSICLSVFPLPFSCMCAYEHHDCISKYYDKEGFKDAPDFLTSNLWASTARGVCAVGRRCSDDRDHNNSFWRTKKKGRGKQSTLKAHWSWKEIAHLCRHIFSHNDPNYGTPTSSASFIIRISYWRNYSSMN